MVSVRRIGNVVLKRTADPFGEALAAAIGQILTLGVAVVPAVPLSGELLLMPYVPGPTLAGAGRFDDAHALGRFWAFDLLTDNGDRLLKGANAANFIVAGGVLHGIDQTLGPAARGTFERGMTVTARRLGRPVSGAVFDDLSRHADLGGREPFCDRFEAGVRYGLRAIAHLRHEGIEEATAPLRCRADCPSGLRELEGLRGIVQAIRDSS